jgi:hypothetical protein
VSNTRDAKDAVAKAKALTAEVNDLEHLRMNAEDRIGGEAAPREDRDAYDSARTNFLAELSELRDNIATHFPAAEDLVGLLYPPERFPDASYAPLISALEELANRL